MACYGWLQTYCEVVLPLLLHCSLQTPPGSPPDVSAQLQTALDRAAKLKKDAESVSVHNAVGNSSSSSEP